MTPTDTPTDRAYGDPDPVTDPGGRPPPARPAATITARRSPLTDTPLDDGDPDDHAGPEAPIDLVRAEITAAVVAADIMLEVPTRPGYHVTFRRDFTADDIRQWRARSKSRRARRARTDDGDNLDEIKFAAMVVVSTCTGIVRRGTAVYDDAGDPMTFRSDELLAMYPEANGQTTQAARLFYASDAYLSAAAEAVLIEAGWGSTLEDAGEDPTPAR